MYGYYTFPPPPPFYAPPFYRQPYYAGAPPGVSFGSIFDVDQQGGRIPLPKPPGRSINDMFGRPEVEGWSTAFKVALVLGSLTAAYFIYKTVKEVGPPSRKAGEAAGQALVHMGARHLSGRRRSPSVEARVVSESPSSSRSPRWLTKYEDAEFE